MTPKNGDLKTVGKKQMNGSLVSPAQSCKECLDEAKLQMSAGHALSLRVCTKVVLKDNQA